MKFLFLILFLSSSVFALTGEPTGHAPPQSKAELCANKDNPDYFKSLVTDPQNRLSFGNPTAGLLHGGLCWWHSQLQRSSLFLAVYHPELPAPSPEEAKHLIESIMKREGVVEIPGFANFWDFSGRYQDLMIDLLARWQISQGIFEFGFIQGLFPSRQRPSKLKASMDRLYDLVENKHEIVYEIQSVPGIESHAWLVLHMAPDGLGGYQLDVIDSNYITILKWTYQNNSENLLSLEGQRFVPRIRRERDIPRYHKLIDSYCAGADLLQPQVGDSCVDINGNTSVLENFGDTGKLICPEVPDQQYSYEDSEDSE